MILISIMYYHLAIAAIVKFANFTLAASTCCLQTINAVSIISCCVSCISCTNVLTALRSVIIIILLLFYEIFFFIYGYVITRKFTERFAKIHERFNFTDCKIENWLTRL